MLFYSAVNMKTLAGMQWTTENLDNNAFYSTADDDMMVNLCKLKQSIDEHVEKRLKNKWPEFPIICTYEMRKSSPPMRKIKNKNFISENEYKWTTYPNFCLGGMYTTSVNVARQLYEISRTHLLINTDDVLITGIWRNILGMPDDMLIETESKLAEHKDAYFHKLKHRQYFDHLLATWQVWLNKCFL